MGGHLAQTYLVGWVGQRALQDLREQIYTPPTGMSIGFFTRNAGGRADLADDERRAGARRAGDRRVVTLFSSHADAPGRDGDPAFLDFRWRSSPSRPSRLAVGSVNFRIMSAGAYRRTREKIANITAYLQETLSGGPRGAELRAGAAAPEADVPGLNEENRQANMATVYLNAAYFPAVDLLSAIGTGSDPALRRLSGR